MKHKHLKSSNHDIYAKLQISSKKARSIRWLDKNIDKMINRKIEERYILSLWTSSLEEIFLFMLPN